MVESLTAAPRGERSRSAKNPCGSILPLMREAALLAAESLGADLGGASELLSGGELLDVVRLETEATGE